MNTELMVLSFFIVCDFPSRFWFFSLTESDIAIRQRELQVSYGVKLFIYFSLTFTTCLKDLAFRNNFNSEK